MKTTTIATAEKRVIKAEIKTITAARRKVISDCNKEIGRINKAGRQLVREHTRATRATDRELVTIDRRLGILHGRL